MNEIASFISLENGEHELLKKEVAAFLDTYFKFMIELLISDNISFFEVFKILKNKEIYADKNIWSEEIRNTSYFTEYDNMIQIVKFFTISKFFSYNIDSNLYKLNDIGKEMVNEKFFLPGSNRFNKEKTIKFIRNALNHNDKESFQLYRLIQKQNDPKIYVEIYLRVPNFHIMVTIDELFELLKPVLQSKSSYTYIYYDNNDNVLEKLDDFINHIEEDIYYEIVQAYDYKNEDIVDGVISEHFGKEFKKRIKFTKEQKEGIMREYNMIKDNDDILVSIFLSRIVEESIPFGMTKVKGFLNDLNNFLPFIYDYDKTYNDYKREYNRLCYNTQREALESFDNIYYSNNQNSRLIRSFVLFSSYILDTVVNDKDSIELNGKLMNKDIFRNSLVHGTYSNVYGDNLFNIAFFDYTHKDNKNRPANDKIMDNYKLVKLDFMDMYENLYNKIKPKEYSLPLDLIIDKNHFKGFKYSFRIKNTIYYVNAEFDNDIPAFLGVKDINGKVKYMSDEDFDLFKDKIMNINFENFRYIFDKDMISFVKKIPDISRESTKRLKKLIEQKDVSIESYYGPIKKEIKELSEICKKHSFIPAITEERIDGKYIPIIRL